MSVKYSLVVCQLEENFEDALDGAMRAVDGICRESPKHVMNRGCRNAWRILYVATILNILFGSHYLELNESSYIAKYSGNGKGEGPKQW